MGKPSYTGCPDRCSGLHPKKCWQSGHIPFVGYLARSCKSQRAAWQIVFERHMRKKKFLWPDEVREFFDLYRNKHPELISRHVLDDVFYYREHGAVYKPYDKDCGIVLRIFGHQGVFDGFPKIPKPDQREQMFFKLASKTLLNLSKGARYEH